MNGVFLGFRNFWKQSFWGWVGLREAVSAHIPDRGGDLWIIISLTMTRLHVLIRAIRFHNMGSVFWRLGTRRHLVYRTDESSSTVESQHAGNSPGCARIETFRMCTSLVFSNTRVLFLFIEGTQVVGALSSVT